MHTRISYDRSVIALAPALRRFVVGVLAAATTLLFAFALPTLASAAVITFSPTSISYPIEQDFNIKITIDAGSDTINASDGDITFDPDYLSISNISKDGSAFSLWTADPTYSNSNGTISYSGGTPNAFSSTGNILTITFKGKKTGTTKVTVNKGSVLAADGKGTDVFESGGEADITLTDAPPEAPADTADTSAALPGDNLPVGQLPPATQVNSQTAPKSDQWYGTSTIKFDWALQPDTLGVRVGVSADEKGKPDQTLSGTPSTSTVVVKDGVSYLLVQLKNDAGWGDVGTKKIQIDTVPPKDFDVALVDGTPPKLSFLAEDELSGVARYEILLSGSVVASPRAQDLSDGTYPVPPQDGGDQEVTIRAYDQAGNMKAVTRTLKLPKVDKPSASGEAAPAQPFWSWERILLILLMFALGALVAWNQNLRNGILAERAKLLHRIAETGDKNDRVFSAMREEFEQMINNLDPKPQLTESERNHLEEVKEVLDTAQEVIDTEFADLKKTVRGQ